METIRVIEIKKQVKRLPRTKVPGESSRKQDLDGREKKKKGK